MSSGNPTILQVLWYNMRLRMLSIMTVLALSIYLVFFLVSVHTADMTLDVSRQFYVSELQLLIVEQLVAAQNAFPEDSMKDLGRRFSIMLDKGVVFQYVTKENSTGDQKAISELKKLLSLAERAYQAKNNVSELKKIYIESLRYPTLETHEDILISIQKSVSQLAIDQQIIFFTLVISFLLAFLALQIIAIRIGIISKTTKNIIAHNNQLDISQRVLFQAYDETAYIANNINVFMDTLEKSVSRSFVFIRQLLYNVLHMFESSQGWKLETQVMRYSTERISRQMINQIDSVNHASAALEEMERTLDIIFNNISRQSAAMTQSAATLEEMGRQVEGVAKISSDTAGLATNLTEVANKGNQAVDASIVSIRDVAEYSTQIIKLLQLITGIAKQTNLLAMNASIEAAHAGEAGQGFAIVAEEIRRLSETTNKNAKEIRTVVDTMVEKIENSVSQVQTAGEDLIQITQYAGNVEERIAQLNRMMQEQNTATHQMITTIEGLVTLTQEIKLSMEEQQHGLHEYGRTITDLKESFSETKSTLDGHMSSVDNLLVILTDMGIRIGIQKEIMSNVNNFLSSYKISDNLIVPDHVIEVEQEKIFLEKKQIIK